MNQFIFFAVKNKKAKKNVCLFFGRICLRFYLTFSTLPILRYVFSSLPKQTRDQNFKIYYLKIAIQEFISRRISNMQTRICKYIMALLRNRMSLLWWLGGSSSFLSLAFPYLLRCQAWKKSGKILYTDTIAKLQAKDLWGPFLHNRDHQVSKQKKMGPDRVAWLNSL